MPSYRHALPQLAGASFLTDAGLETTLVFHVGIDLPHFAAFPLAETEAGREVLRSYFRPFLETAASRGVGFVLSAHTWRANPDWGEKLGYSADALRRSNAKSIEFMAELRDEHGGGRPIVIEGVIGPRGDGYKADRRMTADEAESYHAAQIDAFQDSAADMVLAATLTYPEEAIGIARAAADRGMPCAISFTVETDGRLPSGESLKAAIQRTDAACNGGRPAYYMINCAHPSHFEGVLDPEAGWAKRIRGLRANASTRSHAELDTAPDLDAGDPADLARRYRALRERMPGLCVLGGCCGTDHRHVSAICEACF